MMLHSCEVGVVDREEEVCLLARQLDTIVISRQVWRDQTLSFLTRASKHSQTQYHELVLPVIIRLAAVQLVFHS